MVVRAVSLPILPEPAIFIQVIDRPWIWIAIVEVADFICHTRGGRSGFCLVVQSNLAKIVIAQTTVMSHP